MRCPETELIHVDRNQLGNYVIYMDYKYYNKIISYLEKE